MQVIREKQALRACHAEWRRQGQRIGLVPTMGYLHDGHLSLVAAARGACDRVTATIFVNPTQFGPNEDLASYPRDEARDFAALEAAGVDAVFAPSVEEVYAGAAHGAGDTFVEVPGLSGILIGALRPGHFRGVATVVTKLLNIAQPDDAFFGRKDYQQLRVIQSLAADLDIPARIHGVDTVREPDGLAMSSRNVRLTPQHRAAAPVLYRALRAALKAARGGPDVGALADLVARTIRAEPLADLQTADIRDAATLAPLEGPLTRPAVVLLAVRFGDVLLIDNMVVTPEG